ncbi:methyl-accepting chemotaxis protein [Leptospira harrisiae]|uniref:Chemotaxis protein n=1 Tax=Leptospira harrisiae TaxID=2023189 RepID=A0A2N0AN22_9LEPT|nr:methyl-accepting chemotaxis protein [Leptospira harrisiae]PJZ85699.1 chemotaxis protein [Leptospira harrisiae]PKA09235.1 chemotaxis protein [Leptospira harrisiae]
MKSLKYILGLYTFLSILVLSTVVSALILYLNWGLLVKVYRGEMENAGKSAGAELSNYYKSQLRIAGLLSKQREIKESFQTGKSKFATDLLVGIMQEANGEYENIFLSEPIQNAKIFAAGIPRSIGYQLEESKTGDHVVVALKKQFLIGSVQESPITGLPVSLVSFPIEDNGKLIGILWIALNLEQVSKRMGEGIHVGANGYITAITTKGVVFAGPDKSKILKLDLSKIPEGRPILEAKDGAYFEYTENGKDFAFLIKRLEEWNTIIGVVLPKSDMNSGFIQVALFAVVVVFLITALVVLGVFRFLKKRLLPLENSVLILDKMAKGDLTESFTLTNHDEIGRMNLALDGFVKSIRDSLGEIQSVAEEIASSAEGLRDSSSSFSDMAQGTAASAEEISATTEEVAASMETTAVSTSKQHNNIIEFNEKILELSKGAIQIEKDTKAALANTENITKQAKLGGESLNQMKEVIGVILESSTEMKEVIGIIDEISDQTSLLALNAAIEAARAGEAGRGFAIVAEEISKLSDKTAHSIQSIEDMIGKNSKELEEGAKGIRSSVELLNLIIRDIAEVESVMKRLSEATKSQLNYNQEVDARSTEVGLESESIRGAIEEQKRAIEQISQSVLGINNETMHIATGSDQVASSSQKLSHAAETLRSITKRFTIAKN